MPTMSALSTLSAATVPRSAAIVSESLYARHDQLTVDYRDSEGAFSLSLTRDVLAYQATYTAQGVLSEPFSAATAATPEISNSANTGETDAADVAVQDPLTRYFELIRQQVAVILDELARQRAELIDRVLNGDADTEATTSVATSRLNFTVTGLNSDAFSAESTAERIVNFALSFYSGGDRQAYAEMARAAVMKGFNEAMQAVGGTLPQVSHDTIDLVNRSLDAFAAGGAVDVTA